MDPNLQLRSKLSSDVQRHINESVEDWRITLDNFTSSLEDVKLQVKSNSMSHDAALNEIGELLLTFHDPDENFKKYETHATYLLDIHASDVETTLVNDFTNLVKEWNSLSVNIESLNTSGGIPAEKERITKADIGAENISVETVENEKSSDHQISIDEGFEDDTSAVSIETFDVDVSSSTDINFTSEIETEVDLSADIQVDDPKDNTAFDFLANTHDFSYVDNEVDMSSDTEIETSHIDTHDDVSADTKIDDSFIDKDLSANTITDISSIDKDVDLSADTETDVSHIDTEADLSTDTHNGFANIEKDVEMSTVTDIYVAHIGTEVDFSADNEIDLPLIDREVELTADSEVNVSRIKNEVDLSADTEIDLSHLDTEVDLSADTGIDVAHFERNVDFSPLSWDDVAHIEAEVDLSADNEIDLPLIDREVELTADSEVNVSRIKNEVDLSADTEIDLSHLDTEVDLSADPEIDVAHIGTEGEETHCNIGNKVDESMVADGVDHVDQSIDTNLKIDATAEQVDVNDHAPCSIEASVVGLEEETSILSTEVNKEIDLKNPIDIEPSDGSPTLGNEELESKVENDSENTAKSLQESKELEISGLNEQEKEKGEKDVMVPIEVKDVEADILNSLKHKETIVDYTDEEAKVPSRRNSNFFLRLCCCRFYRANTKTYY